MSGSRAQPGTLTRSPDDRRIPWTGWACLAPGGTGGDGGFGDGSDVERAQHPARVAGGQHALRDVPGDDAAGSDDGARADLHARQDDCASADPDVGPNLQRLARLLAPAQRRIERMCGRVELHRGADDREAADAYRAHVEHHAVEVEEHPLAELDVGAVVAEERGLHPDRIPAGAEERAEDPPAFFRL